MTVSHPLPREVEPPCRTVRWRPPPAPPNPPVVTLTVRQAEVLALICCGLSSPEIGARLFITEDTAKTHTKRMFAALGARNRTHAAAMACSGQVAIHVTEGNAA